jgi:hypothetical protein
MRYRATPNRELNRTGCAISPEIVSGFLIFNLRKKDLQLNDITAARLNREESNKCMDSAG